MNRPNRCRPRSRSGCSGGAIDAGFRSLKLHEVELPVIHAARGLRRARGTAESGGIPIAAGRNVSTLMDFERLMAAGAVDFVQPSVANMGGITEMVKVFPEASIRKVIVMPHSFYDGPGLLAAMHAAAALGTPEVMIEWRHFDLEAQIYRRIAPRSGRIRCRRVLAWVRNPIPMSFETIRHERTPNLRDRGRTGENRYFRLIDPQGTVWFNQCRGVVSW